MRYKIKKASRYDKFFADPPVYKGEDGCFYLKTPSGGTVYLSESDVEEIPEVTKAGDLAPHLKAGDWIWCKLEVDKVKDGRVWVFGAEDIFFLRVTTEVKKAEK